MLLNLIFMTDKEPLLSAAAESRMWIRENLEEGICDYAANRNKTTLYQY